MRVCRSCRAACPEAARFCLLCGSELPSWCADDAERLLGQVIAGNFRLVEFVGEGAMGRVYRAEQLSLGKSVAVKLLHPRLRADASFIKRFENEARAASRLNHPNSVAVIDFGQTSGGEPFIVMEYVRGSTLREVNDDEFPLRPSRVAGIIGQVAGALGEAHELGVLHRDLKPDNVIVQQLRDGRDHVKVVDFGLAALIKSPQMKASVSGQIWGTPQYLAPERLRGQPASPQTDIYSIGAMLYELLVSTPPYDGKTALEAVNAALTQVAVPPSKRRPDLRIHPALEGIAMRCIEKSPTLRFSSAGELREKLEAFVAVRATDRSVDCPRCGTENRGRARFCSECGLALASASSADEALFKEQPTTIGGKALTIADVEQHSKQKSQDVAPSVPASPRRSNPPFDSRSVDAFLRMPLVGRTRELARLRDWLEVDRSGAFLVAGEPGIGKTRLAQEVLADARTKGFRTICVGPDPSRAADPWWPMERLALELLELAPRPSEAQVLAALLRVGLEDGDLLGMCELLDVGDGPHELERNVRLRELRASMRRLLEITATAQPTILLLEDLERFDRPSLSLLGELALKPPPGRLHLLFTARRSDPVGFPDRIERLQLTPLGPDDMATLGAEFARVYNVDGPTLEQLAATMTPGLPLSVEQLRYLVTSGRMGVPTSLPDLVATRVTWLAPASRQLLQAAAAIGLEATVEVLMEVASDREAFSSVLRYLEDNGWLWHDLNRHTVTFSHDFVQEIVYAMTPRTVLQDLHRNVAGALAMRRAAPTAVGDQRFRAGDLARAVGELEATGDRCGRRFDDHASAEWYRRAYTGAVSPDQPDDPRAMPRISLKLASALRWNGDLIGAETIAREGLGRATDFGDVIGLRRLLATLAVDRAALPEARRELEAAIETAIGAREPDATAGLQADLSVVLASDGQIEAAIALLRTSVAQHGNQASGVPWRVLARLGELYWYSDQTAEARKYLEEALTQARRTDSKIGVARVHSLLAGLLVRLGDAHAAEDHRSDAVISLRAIGDRTAALELELDTMHATQRIPDPT